MLNAKPCPFCGFEINLDDYDVLYPSGTGWKEEDCGDGTMFRHYVSSCEVPKEQWCYKLICNQSMGGCGAEMHGDSEQETIEKWNQRT